MRSLSFELTKQMFAYTSKNMANSDLITNTAISKFSSPCACAAVRRAARLVTQMYDEAMKPAGLRSTQFILLLAISEFKTVNQRDLSSEIDIDFTGLSRGLKILDKSGLIRSAEGLDKRERHWSLTAKGERKLKETLPLWQEVQTRLAAQLKSLEWNNLFKAADQISAAAKAA